MTDRERFGEAIRKERTKRGMTQTDLANESGCSQSHVSLLERGAPVGLVGIVRILWALGIPITRLNALKKTLTERRTR